MKYEAMLFNLAMVGLLACSTCRGAGGGEIKSIDLNKVRAERAVRFIEHVFWPSETSTAKRISKETIPEDMQQFKDMLRIALKAPYAVTPEAIDANAVAVEEPRPGDANDYILLEYTRNRRQIRIQDGKGLYISVFPDPNVELPPMAIAEYVKTTAFEILNAPKSDEDGNEPRVHVSILDIGGSHWGNITYPASYPSPGFWYSHMWWWSDGRNIMFLMGKRRFAVKADATLEGASHIDRARAKARSERAGPSPDMFKPRKFRKKASTGSPGNAP